MPANGKKSCCTWQRAVILVVLLAVAAILIWRFAPIEGTVDKIVPTLNETFGGDGNDESENEGGGGGNDEGEGGGGDDTTELFPYQFFQCADKNDLANCCNGLDGICDLGVDEILWATSHNAMSSRDGGFWFGYNHIAELEGSLDAGYRAISLDICNCGGEYQLCHGICTLGARDPVEVFDNIVQFLDENPTEVIMINMQVNSEVSDEVSLSTLAELLGDNVMQKLYVHDPTVPWPSLGTLTSSGKNLLFFHLNGPDCASGECPSGFHYWFDYAAETEFQFETADEFSDVANSCSITRGAGSTKDFFAVTSFVTPALQEESEKINTRDFLESRISACSGQNGLDVNLMYVDFWTIGDLPEVVQEHNKALAARRKERGLRRY